MWILLADDDADDIEMLEEAIVAQAPTARVHSFSDGREVMHFLNENDIHQLPCTMVLDYNMPRMTGLEVLEQVAKNPTYESIPKLIWSTSARAEHVTACLNQGATDYLVKPNNPRDLQKLASTVINYCLKTCGDA
jgi:CheY-like chemotaxis protein